MRRWEAIAVILAVLAVLGTIAGAFLYQLSREGPSLASPRSASIFVPRGDSEAGRQVYLNSCASCHGPNAEGAYGPDLRNVYRAGAYFLYAFTLDPKAVNIKATMPKLPHTQKELADVVAYLMSLKKTVSK